MIQITRKAIDSTLEETVNAHRRGQLKEFQMDVEKRVRMEKPLLHDYINSGISYLEKVEGEEGQLIRAGYRSGAHLTFRMIEAQLNLNRQQSPNIVKEDIEKANESVDSIVQIGVNDVTLTKISMIRNKNPEFGNYVTAYIKYQAPPYEIVARGFALGVITTYTAYEQAFKRLKSE